MKKFLVATTLFALVAVPANAEVYTYACRMTDSDNSKMYAAKVDFTKNTVAFGGVVYKNLKQVKIDADNLECAKHCIEATSGRYVTLAISFATKGVATLTWMSSEPRNHGRMDFHCDPLH